MTASRSTRLSVLGMPALLLTIALASLFLAGCRRESSESVDESDVNRVDARSEGAARGAAIRFLEKVPIGDPVSQSPPWITNVNVVDLDGDGLLDVVLCDAKANQISWIHQQTAGTYLEEKIGSLVLAPAHVQANDIDRDGDLDLLVAEMGIINPSNDKIGSVVVLENDGHQQFSNRVLIDNVARVTDVEPGDFDGDGDTDLAVGQFGYHDGEMRWMENRGNWQFESHQLLNLSGTIHTPVADMDGDGDLDITAVVAQEWEEIYLFENDGGANFQEKRIYASTNEDFGSSGISLADLDRDGDLDVLYTNGDAFDYQPPEPRPWHGVQWLENKGGLEFEYHRIADFPGAFFANAIDADGDGDLDLFVVSLFNRWNDPEAQSMIWFENNGQQHFTLRDLASSPTHLVTLDHGDMDGDGWVDLVTGGMYAFPPFERMSRVTLWRNNWPGRKTGE
jgi:hypothetical protein